MTIVDTTTYVLNQQLTPQSNKELPLESGPRQDRAIFQFTSYYFFALKLCF